MTTLILAALLVPDATPTATVQAFVEAVNAHDAPAAARRVVDGKPAGPLPRSERAKLEVRVGAERIDGDAATVELDAGFRYPGLPLRTTHESLSLRRVDDDWRIVPAAVPSGSRTPWGPSLVGSWASVVTNANLLTQARRARASSESLSKSKVIALAAFLYADEHKGRLPSAATFRSDVTPYFKHMKDPLLFVGDVFVAPDTPKGTTYFLDPRLSGRTLSSLDRISEIAMIVMGQNGRATFPYGGQTVLSFADGHTMRVKPEAAYKARTIPLG